LLDLDVERGSRKGVFVLLRVVRWESAQTALVGKIDTETNAVEHPEM